MPPSVYSARGLFYRWRPRRLANLPHSPVRAVLRQYQAGYLIAISVFDANTSAQIAAQPGAQPSAQQRPWRKPAGLGSAVRDALRLMPYPVCVVRYASDTEVDWVSVRCCATQSTKRRVRGSVLGVVLRYEAHGKRHQHSP